jgi:hypothetical protein
MNFVIETIGGTGEEGKSTFVAGEDSSMRVLLQLRNTGQEGYDKGVIDVDEESLVIAARGVESMDFREGFVRRPGQCGSPATGNALLDPGGDTASRQGQSQNSPEPDDGAGSPGDGGGSGSGDLGGVNPRTVESIQRDDSNVYSAEGGSTVTEDECYRWEGDSSLSSGVKCSMDKNTPLRMFEGQSRVITCDVEVPESIENPASVLEISASVDYSYKKQLGTRTVEVKSRGQ